MPNDLPTTQLIPNNFCDNLCCDCTTPVDFLYIQGVVYRSKASRNSVVTMTRLRPPERFAADKYETIIISTDLNTRIELRRFRFSCTWRVLIFVSTIVLKKIFFFITPLKRNRWTLSFKKIVIRHFQRRHVRTKEKPRKLPMRVKLHISRAWTYRNNELPLNS